MAATENSTLKKGTRIVNTAELPGVPEGTAGKVGDNVGMALIRYRVAFDNGAEKTSVAHTKLVREGEWEAFKENREKEATAAAEAAAKAAAAPPAEAKAEAPADGDSPPVNDRMAALLAKSAAAKAKKLAESGG